MQLVQETHEDEESVVSEPTVSEEVVESEHEEQDPSLKQNGNVTIEQQRKDPGEEKTRQWELKSKGHSKWRLVKTPGYLRDYMNST